MENKVTYIYINETNIIDKYAQIWIVPFKYKREAKQDWTSKKLANVFSLTWWPEKGNKNSRRSKNVGKGGFDRTIN